MTNQYIIGKFTVKFTQTQQEINKAIILAKLNRIRRMRQHAKIASYFGKKASDIVICHGGIIFL